VTPLGRERLEALLGDYEFRNKQREPDERADLSGVRKALGLDSRPTAIRRSARSPS
jgi:hypothetical protein